MVDHLTTARRTARREHRCFMRLHPILVGWPYMDSRHVADGRAYTIREHVGCAEHADRLGVYHPRADSYSEGALVEAVLALGHDWHHLCRRWAAYARARRVRLAVGVSHAAR